MEQQILIISTHSLADSYMSSICSRTRAKHRSLVKLELVPHPRCGSLWCVYGFIKEAAEKLLIQQLERLWCIYTRGENPWKGHDLTK